MADETPFVLVDDYLAEQPPPGVGLGGKTLGAIGSPFASLLGYNPLDVEGARASTPWGDAAYNTARSLDPVEMVKQTHGAMKDAVLTQNPQSAFAATSALTGLNAPFAVSGAAGAMGGKLTGAMSPNIEKALALGFTGPWYHGTNRLDRFLEGKALKANRATSGPMPYFTDNPELATKYATGKTDTSLPDDFDISRAFTVDPKALGWKGARSPIPVEQSWHYLPPEIKAQIAERAPRVGYANREMATGPFTLHDEFGGISSPDHWNYTLSREARGNPLTALRNIWHDGGDLVGNESELAKIFRLAGYPHQVSDKMAPWYSAEGVMPAMLRFNNPLDTNDLSGLTNKVIPSLSDAFRRDRTRLKEFGADAWDKNSRYTPKDWVKELETDLGAGKNSFVWTSIPDKVTEQLSRLGYDGVLDRGGKQGGEGHNVAIPFRPDQVRSLYAKFDKDKLHDPNLLAANRAPTPFTFAGEDQPLVDPKDGGFVY